MYMYSYVHMHVCMYMYSYVHMHIQLHTYEYIYIACMNVYIYGWLVGLAGFIFRCSHFDQAFALSVASASFVISTINCMAGEFTEKIMSGADRMSGQHDPVEWPSEPRIWR